MDTNKDNQMELVDDQSKLQHKNSDLCEGYDMVLVSQGETEFYVHRDVVSIFSKKLQKLIMQATQSKQKEQILRLALSEVQTSDLQILLNFIYHVGFDVNLLNYSLILDVAESFECPQLSEEVLNQIYLQEVASKNHETTSVETFQELFYILIDNNIPQKYVVHLEKIAQFIAKCVAHQLRKSLRVDKLREFEGHNNDYMKGQDLRQKVEQSSYPMGNKAQLRLYIYQGQSNGQANQQYENLNAFLKDCEMIQSQKIAQVLLSQLIKSMVLYE